MYEVAALSEVKRYVFGLEAIIFDLDDTLYDEKDYIKSGYKKAAEVLAGVQNAEEKLWNAFLNGKNAIDEVLKNEKIYSDELKNKCLSVYRSQIPDIALPGESKKLLDYLRKSGYKLGLITDGRPEGQRAKINVLGLTEYFDCIIITDELGGIDYRKPNETAFRLMSEKLGTPFDKMCYVGDNIAKDFIAPEQLGMRSIYYKNANGLYV